MFCQQQISLSLIDSFPVRVENMLMREKRIAYNFKRLRKSRGFSVPYLAEKGNVSESYLRQIEAGLVTFGHKAERKWSEILACDISEFTKVEHEESLGVPVIAYISAGGGNVPTSPDQYALGDGLEYLDLPPGYNQERVELEGIYGLRVRGESMLPILRDGSRLYIKPNGTAHLGNGDLVIFRDESGVAWVKEIELANHDTIIFRSVGVGPTIIKRRDEITRLDEVWLIKR